MTPKSRPMNSHPAKELCVWSYDDIDDAYSTSCRKMFQITEGTAKENGMKFCCYCGKPIKEEKS